MTVLVWGLFLFFCGFAAHVAVWRIRKPRQGGRALVLTFLTVFAVMWQAWSPVDFAEAFHGLVIALCLMAAYVASYPAAEADSPTLLIITKVMAGGAEGLSRDELFESMDDDLLTRPRIQDLLTGGLATLEEGVYRPTVKGRLLALVFIAFRGLLGAPKGG